MLWDEVLSTLGDEFSDLGSAGDLTRVLLRLVLAVVLAGLIGADRERHQSAAGLRTHMLVGIGSALFVIAPQHSGMELTDVSRVIQGIVAGIGFLGAGAIIK